MALERTRRVGPYAPLSATYYYDDELALAGENAELLFVRGLAFSAQVMNDGFISDIQLVRQVGVGMADAVDRAAALVEHGLWERVDGGYVVRSWLRWNKSAEEVGRYRAKDAARKAKGPKTDARAESDQGKKEDESDSEGTTARIPRGIPAESDGNPPHRSTSLHNTSSSAKPPEEETPLREDVTRLCNHLADRIEANGSKRPRITKAWEDAARLMLDKDGRTERQIRYLIDWSQNDEFWRGNILSMPKLREKFDQLRLKVQSQNGSQEAPAQPRPRPRDAWMERQ